MGATELIGQQSSDDVIDAAGRKRNDDPDRSGGLRPGAMACQCNDAESRSQDSPDCKSDKRSLPARSSSPRQDDDEMSGSSSFPGLHQKTIPLELVRR